MDFAFSEEQEMLRSTVRTFVDRSYPESKVRELMAGETGHDPALWRQMADQLGLPGLAISEKHGGSGFGFQEIAIVMEELGRALVPAPFLASVVQAGTYLVHCGDDAAQADYLPPIAAGTTIATLAIAEESSQWDLDGISLAAASGSDGPRLSGTKLFVVDGALADLVLVAAREGENGPEADGRTEADGGAEADGRLSVYAVERGAAGLTVQPLQTLDQTRKLAHLHFDGTPARLVGPRGGAAQALEMSLYSGAIALAMEAVGGAQRALEMAVDYAKIRQQFGRPIGSFQAIKHKCADMLVEVEAARSAAYYGVWCASERNAELPLLASLAKSVCADAYFQVAGDNIQVHGGIGYTWEHPAHLYFKRAKSTQILLGDSSYHRDRLATLANIG